ncbi:molybdopterin molybdotransferase MoeA [Ferrimonas balearica]|uniref:molybdopterin molybdotransferase MoeA n=1 Tax=Ferrimonas balearica TaxID=44012 RepID=UPI001C5B6B1A|nr:molybdopterin molybdotransferase MoeA [Ferrimonas balearica]MBW3166452.1 molybdopterin molybdotransferase MoeA [Ferrimonas balearica]MBY6226049.1 molybdopterin molybdotransferase MoeA [Ferrimonas balearica]
MSHDCCSQPGLMLPADALARMREQVAPLDTEQWVSLEQCPGRVLARDIAAAIDLPPFDNSAMDGYAVRAADVAEGAVLTVAGKAFAGVPFEGEVGPGQCVRIMTGAALPAGLDSIVMQEVVEAEGEDRVRFTESVRPGHFVRSRGSELRAGTVVLKAGTRISAAEVGVLATVGVAEVPVRPKLVVALFSTGDELKAPGTELAVGEIYDSNRHALRSMLTAMGCEVRDLGVIPDDLEQVRDAFRRADAEADVVITSGGVSVGEADFIKVVLDEMGQISFWKLAIKPGKPFAFGRLPNAWFCGLPGNPVSSMVTCYQLVQPLLAHLAGEPFRPALTLDAVLQDDLRKAPGRQEYQRGILSRAEDGTLIVTSTGAQGSDMTTSMSRANCFIILPREQGDTAAGSRVTVEPFNAVLGGL